MDFYAYLYLREDSTPYYAGKGSGKRAVQLDPNHYPPKDRSRILILPMISEEEALEYERRLIALFGRKANGTGCLHNLTDGGDNPPRTTPETAIKISQALKGRKLSDSHRQAISHGGMGHPFYGGGWPKGRKRLGPRGKGIL